MLLTPEQLYLIGIAAGVVGLVVTILVQIVLAIASLLGKPVDGEKAKQMVLLIVGTLVSLALAFLWAKPIFPAIPPVAGDPTAFTLALLQWIGTAVALLVSVVALGHVIYEALMKSVVFPKLPFLRLPLS